MDVVTRIKEMLNAQRCDIEFQVGDLVDDVTFQLEDESIDVPDDVRKVVIEAMHEMLMSPVQPALQVEEIEEKREIRLVTLTITGETSFEVESEDEFDDCVESIRCHAEDLGLEQISITGDYSTSPVVG